MPSRGHLPVLTDRGPATAQSRFPTEQLVETVSDGIPWDLLPTHSRLKARNVGLRCARHIHQRRVTRFQVSEVGNLVGPQRTPNAGMLRPAMYARLKEGAVDDQLTAALKQ